MSENVSPLQRIGALLQVAELALAAGDQLQSARFDDLYQLRTVPARLARLHTDFGHALASPAGDGISGWVRALRACDYWHERAVKNVPGARDALRAWAKHRDVIAPAGERELARLEQTWAGLRDEWEQELTAAQQLRTPQPIGAPSWH